MADFGANRAFVASPSSRCASRPVGFDHGYGELSERIAKLLHPTRGVCRGIIETDEQGKGGRDPDSKLTNISFGELREIHAVLSAIAIGETK